MNVTARLAVPAVTAVAAAMVLSGCAEPEPSGLAVPSPPTCLRGEPPEPLTAPAPAVPEPPPHAVSVEGRRISCSVHGRGRPTVLVLGGIHGNEPAGVPLCRRLCAHLAQRPDALAGRRVVVAPATNPDGLAHHRRTNARGVDLNRNFATANWQDVRRHGSRPLSEPESRFIAALIDRYRPAAIVTIHQPLACVDWDGPGEALARRMARACGLPARKLGARAGSLGSFAGVDRQIPTVTLELPKNATALDAEQLWRRYGGALLVAIRFGPGPAVTRGAAAFRAGTSGS
jgi:protein MpaA